MKSNIRMGLIAGGIALVINTCVSFAFGLCGPVVALVAGAFAGFFAARASEQVGRNNAAREGAISGLIAGGMTMVGQYLGGLTVLLLIPALGMDLPFGQVPPIDDPGQMSLYMLSGLGVATCFGVAGLVLSSGAGALAAYLATDDEPELTMG